MNIKPKELTIVIVLAVCLAIAAIICASIGAASLTKAMDADCALQLAKNGIYDPSIYASAETMHATMQAKNTMLVGVAFFGVAGGIVGIFFTCKWIRSLIPHKE